MKVLIAADAEWVRKQVRAAFVGPGHEPDLVILDMQIGNMGGIAVAIDLRLEESAGRLPRATILLLLDRVADNFVAERADADATLVKPVDAGTLRRTAKRLAGAHT